MLYVNTIQTPRPFLLFGQSSVHRKKIFHFVLWLDDIGLRVKVQVQIKESLIEN